MGYTSHMQPESTTPSQETVMPVISNDPNAIYGALLAQFGKDAWGRPLMQAGDGHSAWSCNNYACTEHTSALYAVETADEETADELHGDRNLCGCEDCHEWRFDNMFTESDEAAWARYIASQPVTE